MAGNKLVTLKPEGKIVFVGDTHGELDASEEVVKRYSPSSCKLVFLGDYVDRGPLSRENADFVLGLQKDYPERVFALQGNHENYPIVAYDDCKFWHDLILEDAISCSDLFSEYSQKFCKLPYAVSVGEILALHGALPNISRLEEIESIATPEHDLSDGAKREISPEWKAVLWGDFNNNGDVVYPDYNRPRFSRSYFEGIMQKLGKNLLIRSHQPWIPISLYNGRLVTLFSAGDISRKCKRTIAIADFNKTPQIKSIDDLTIEEI